MGYTTSTIESVSQFATLMLIQSTLLIAAAFLAIKLLRLRDAALMSVIYRTVLIASLVSPFATMAMLRSDINGWWPKQWSESSIAVMEATPQKDRPAFNAEAIVHSQPQIFPHAPQIVFEPSTETAKLGAAEASGTLALPVRHNSSTAEPARATSSAFTAKSTLLAAWALISSLLLFRLWRTHQRLWKTLSMAVPVEPAVQSFCDRLAHEMKVSPPRVVCSPYFTSPFLAGLVHPVVHLSSDLADDQRDRAEPIELRDILVHELAHLKRRDVGTRLLNHFVLAVFFFQPLLWRLVKWIEDTAEDVCDDYAMTFGARRDHYAGRLVDLAERCDFPLGSAVGIASGKSMLVHRVTRIMDHSRKLSTKVGRKSLALCGCVTFAAVITVCLLMTPANVAIADPPQEVPVTQQSSPPLPQSQQTQPQTAVPKVQSKSDWPQDIVRGTVLGHSGPLEGAEVYWWRSRVHDMEPMQPIRVVTDANGKFELRRTPPNPNDPAIWDMRESMVVRAEGYAFEHTWPKKFGAVVPYDPDWPAQHETQPSAGDPLKLVAEGTNVSGRLVDIEGQPISDARVRIRWFSKSRNASLPHSQSGFWARLGKPKQTKEDTPERTEEDWIDDVGSVVQSIEQVPLRDALPMATTDQDGKFELTGVPSDSIFQLLVERKGIQSTDIVVRNYGGDQVITVPQKEGYTHSPPTTLYPAKFQAIIGPSVALVGTVTDAETGEPIPGAIIRTNVVGNLNVRSSRDLQHLCTRTDEKGRYRIDGLPLSEKNNVEVSATGEVAYMPISSLADTSAADAVSAGQSTLDFQLRKGIWAEGRVYEPDTDEAFQGEVSYYWFRNQELEAGYPGSKDAFLDGRYFTDSDGHFRIPVLPTAGIIAFSTGNRDHKRMAVYSRGFGENELARFRNPEDSFPNYETVPYDLMPGNYNRLALIEPKPGEQVVTLDMPLSASKPIPVLILNPDNTPAAERLEIYGGNDRWGWEDKSAQGFVVEDLLVNQKRKVIAFDRQRNLVGGTIVEHGEGKTFEIRLSPAGSVRGRLIDADGLPISHATLVPDGELDDQQHGVWANELGKRSNPTQLTVDKEGRFEVHGLSPHWKYSAWVDQEKENMSSMLIGKAFEELQIEPNETRDLGDVVIKNE